MVIEVFIGLFVTRGWYFLVILLMVVQVYCYFLELKRYIAEVIRRGERRN